MLHRFDPFATVLQTQLYKQNAHAEAGRVIGMSMQVSLPAVSVLWSACCSMSGWRYWRKCLRVLCSMLKQHMCRSKKSF